MLVLGGPFIIWQDKRNLYIVSNRQIILRSDIKSLQPFESCSNLLQVTCDLC